VEFLTQVQPFTQHFSSNYTSQFAVCSGRSHVGSRSQALLSKDLEEIDLEIPDAETISRAVQMRSTWIEKNAKSVKQ
jgi:hypothetical protein